MAGIFQTTFSNAFSWTKMYAFRFRFHWSLFLRFQIHVSSIGSDNALVPTSDGITDAYMRHSLCLNELVKGAPGISHQSRGGYSLYVGWYGCAAVLTPFFDILRIELDLFGVFFSSTNTKTIFWGIKTTNSYRIRSFRPQISFFPRSFWVQVSAASGTPPSVFGPRM